VVACVATSDAAPAVTFETAAIRYVAWSDATAHLRPAPLHRRLAEKQRRRCTSRRERSGEGRRLPGRSGMLETLRRIVEDVSAAPHRDQALAIIVRRVKEAMEVHARFISSMLPAATSSSWPPTD
jgi:hypothetical protein